MVGGVWARHGRCMAWAIWAMVLSMDGLSCKSWRKYRPAGQPHIYNDGACNFESQIESCGQSQRTHNSGIAHRKRLSLSLALIFTLFFTHVFSEQDYLTRLGILTIFSRLNTLSLKFTLGRITVPFVVFPSKYTGSSHFCFISHSWNHCVSY
jgi:hypothetical protein